MKVGEVKIEALKLMFANNGQDIRMDNLEGLAEDEQYRYYLVNMTGAINRCFSCIEEKRVLPVKSFRLEPFLGLASGRFIRFDLSALIEDFFDIERIVRQSEDGYDGERPYMREGNTLVLENEEEGGEYFLLYKPTIPRVTSLTEDEKEIPIPEGIAAHIPYFIKGDLYRDDEPNEASEARNWFEQAMIEIAVKTENKPNNVKSVYTMG